MDVSEWLRETAPDLAVSALDRIIAAAGLCGETFDGAVLALLRDGQVVLQTTTGRDGEALRVVMDASDLAYLEGEINRRGLVSQYLDALLDALFGDSVSVYNSAIELGPISRAPHVDGNTSEWEGYDYLWALLTMSAETRSRLARFVLEANP